MDDKLNILWTSDNPHTAHTMVFMYAIAAKTQGWFNEVEIIIWGASAKLVAEDEGIQEKIKMAQYAGVVVKACIGCTNTFGVTEKLKSLELEVGPMGVPLTTALKDNEKLLTV
ncbi:MAG: DsrE family protein [Epulopiscium sp. Nele67-Bin004]|nr:MAG: DsrE family protein [Epulopiscium sp. Nele67-Bin004]